MPLSDSFHEKARELIARYPVARSALLMLLHEAQDEVGYVSSEVIREVATLLNLTPAEVAGVASFYTMYKRQPQGRHLISLCTNVSCGIAGADQTAETLQDLIGPPNRPAPDGVCSWEPVECLAYCSWAPIAQVDYHDIPYLTPVRAELLVEGLRAGRPVDDVLRELREAQSLKEATDG